MYDSKLALRHTIRTLWSFFFKEKTAMATVGKIAVTHSRDDCLALSPLSGKIIQNDGCLSTSLEENRVILARAGRQQTHNAAEHTYAGGKMGEN